MSHSPTTYQHNSYKAFVRYHFFSLLVEDVWIGSLPAHVIESEGQYFGFDETLIGFSMIYGNNVDTHFDRQIVKTN